MTLPDRSEPATVARLQQRILATEKALLASLLATAWMVEVRDPYTGGHLWRVAMMSAAVAQALGDTPAQASRIAVAGFLHDLGKIGVPDAILRKPDRLTDEEFATIKTHPGLGARLLANHPLAPLVLDAIQGHHEMPSGAGYPLGLAGPAIARDALIVGVCDAFDAMTSTRPYRKGMPIAKALDIIHGELGRQFDGAIGRVFIQMGREGAFDHIVGHSDQGIPLLQCPVCGPTIVRHRSAQAGDHAVCRSCQSGFELEALADGQLAVSAPTHGLSADELAPAIDQAQISALVENWSNALAASNDATSG